jgi:hypothetical protein
MSMRQYAGDLPMYRYVRVGTMRIGERLVCPGPRAAAGGDPVLR